MTPYDIYYLIRNVPDNADKIIWNVVNYNPRSKLVWSLKAKCCEVFDMVRGAINAQARGDKEVS